MPSLRHYDTAGTARFVTFSTYKRIRALEDDRLKQILIDELIELRNKHKVKILGYVIMPDHVHLVLDPPDGVELGRLIGQLKSKSARRYFELRSDMSRSVPKVLWLRRCYDHNCRDTDSVVEKIRYCHNNPLKKRLEVEPGQWKWSSYRWYQGNRDVPLEIDGIEM